MRIAMIGQKGIPTRFGGIERHVEALAVRLGRRGHAVTVYTRGWYAPGVARFSEGVRVVETWTLKTKHLDAIVHTLTATVHAIRTGVDVIHYHGVGPSLLAWIPRVFAPKVRVVSTFHCVDKNHQKWGLFARLALGFGERAAVMFPHETVAVSKTLQSYCMNRFGGDVRYVPNGVETPEVQGDSTLAERGLTKDGYILFVARLVRHKGAHHLIEAYQRLKKAGQTQGMKLAIVGDTAFTDDYVRELRALADGDTDIVFTGYLQGQALAEVFANAHVVVHPSESEGLPIAVLEAMSYGKAVLASDIPENMEAIGAHGLSFRNRGVEDLTRKLRAMLEKPEVSRALGESAKAHVLTNYRWDDVAAEIEKVYEELAHAAAKRREMRTARA